MEILIAKPEDLIEVLFLIRQCVKDMNARGMKHWNSSYPSNDDIIKDLDNNSIFLVKDKGVCLGMMTINEVEPDEYKCIKWADNNSRILYMKRLAVHPLWQDHGIDKMLVDYAQKFAGDKGYQYVRLDTLSSNTAETKLFMSNEFTEVGEFHSTFQKTPFKCYEKKI